MILFAILIFSAYVAGSINFSIILFKFLGKTDPRKSFSGNAGAVNVYRQGGIFWALLIVFLDMGRAMGVSLVALYFLPVAYIPWIGFSLILGNCFPCFHKYRGGKGVSNYLGFTVIITPVSAVIAAMIWGIVYMFFHIPFISSFFMVLILAVGTIITYSFNPISSAGVLVTVLLIYYKHKRNVIDFLEQGG